MSLLLNILIVAVIIGGAGVVLYRHLKKSKAGSCPACEYDCAAKQQLKKHQREQHQA
ncbi:FeoB-associated Cys-rich membrane protein [Levilactobacillus yiduensis]|uniref:FeoB-associated Cys-rich membrane protein n=1 Tax=Levilactobacillus yiduensis TaxID=2953880 RepID=UPI000EF34DC9|nr:FeoB-associated Cys-rich membrane protein [Levilactobacillus yiduensis]AYM01617.1 FeoB-associated Cys-rich membrane protein [Levilactobacillus brevis]